jgi:hypothetical protein
LEIGWLTEVKIPFGRSVDDEMVSVDAVHRGLDCNCVCASCGARLVARKGEINQHHFAHHIEPEHCVAARETSIHKYAKGLICEALELRLPDSLDLGQVRGAKLEPWLGDIRPDVLIEFDEPVAIEILVAHPVDNDKLKKITLRKLATLEIDLSSYRNADKTEVEWRDLILRTAPRFWLFQPTILREEMERRAREAAELRLRREREAQEAAERQEKIRQEEQAESERRRKHREYLYRLDCEYEEMVSAEIAARKAKQAQAKLEQRKHLDNQEQRYLAGLKICADTARHLAEWERRKAAHREVTR